MQKERKKRGGGGGCWDCLFPKKKCGVGGEGKLVGINLSFPRDPPPPQNKRGKLFYCCCTGSSARNVAVVHAPNLHISRFKITSSFGECGLIKFWVSFSWPSVRGKTSPLPILFWLPVLRLPASSFPLLLLFSFVVVRLIAVEINGVLRRGHLSLPPPLLPLQALKRSPLEKEMSGEECSRPHTLLRCVAPPHRLPTHYFCFSSVAISQLFCTVRSRHLSPPFFSSTCQWGETGQLSSISTHNLYPPFSFLSPSFFLSRQQSPTRQKGGTKKYLPLLISTHVLPLTQSPPPSLHMAPPSRPSGAFPIPAAKESYSGETFFISLPFAKGRWRMSLGNWRGRERGAFSATEVSHASLILFCPMLFLDR